MAQILSLRYHQTRLPPGRKTPAATPHRGRALMAVVLIIAGILSDVLGALSVLDRQLALGGDPRNVLNGALITQAGTYQDQPQVGSEILARS